MEWNSPKFCQLRLKWYKKKQRKLKSKLKVRLPDNKKVCNYSNIDSKILSSEMKVLL